MTEEHRRPSARTWLLALAELAAAGAVARLIGRSPAAAPAGHDHMAGRHGMPGRPGMAGAPVAHWGWLEYTAIGVAVVALAWWLLLRRRSAAVLAAAGAAALAAAPAMRVLATQSHLIAMIELELALVILPLLILAAARPRAEHFSARQSRTWTLFVVASALLYVALLIVIHLPAVHNRSAQLDSVPWWVVALALAIGMAYWPAVLRTAGRVPTQIRRAALLGAQEIAAFIGLLSLFGAWGGTTHASPHISPLGISMQWDQRLGGVFMMATCAAVTIPIARRMVKRSVPSKCATSGLNSL